MVTPRRDHLHMIEEIECPACDELLQVEVALDQEVQFDHPGSMTSVPGPATISVAGEVVHRCAPDDASGDGSARRVRVVLPGAQFVMAPGEVRYPGDPEPPPATA